MQRIVETCSYVYLHLCARLQPLVLLARRTIEFAFSRHLVRMSRLPVHNCIKSAGAEKMTALKTVAAKERSRRRGQAAKTAAKVDLLRVWLRVWRASMSTVPWRSSLALRTGRS